ncbi:MAG: type II CRISPR-associated endonuclease Cas1 [Alphaproteobacteria bacterium]|nr:type II CRISPR-associated endonuclease Cas1 [Alphaproteobacteria bacterium]
MHGNIIEIGTDNKKLSVQAGFLRISEQNEVIKDIPFDLILSVVIASPTVFYTQPLLQRLAEEGIPLIVCGKNFVPSGIYLPLIGHYKQSRMQRLQFDASLVLQKRLWQQIVKEKVRQQAAVLQKLNKQDLLTPLITKINSGDSTNIEATAARRYFTALFGKDFKRDADAEGINSFLNYGYAVMRACVARFVVAVGLNPALSVKHQNQLNPLCLVDDLMEPFRPLVDYTVYQIFIENHLSENETLVPAYKKILSGILDLNLKAKNEISPVYLIIEDFVRQYADSVSEKQVMLFSKYVLPDV